MNDAKKTMNIFLVDDEPMVLRALKRVLRKEGYNIEAFGSAQEVLEQMEHRQPDCLVSDYYMPKKDGLELLAEVHERWPEVYRVMLTGGYLDDRVQQAIDRGDVHLLIRKPWKMEDIQKLLDAVRERKNGVLGHQPANPAIETARSEDEKPAETPQQRKQTVLVVDDEESFVAITSAWLEQLGFNALAEYRAEPVLEIIREKQPDAVIIDIILPGVDGIELIGAIRDLQPELPIIAVTGVRDRNLGVDAFRRGATAFLHKPFNMDTLEATLRCCLQCTRFSAPEQTAGELEALLQVQHAIASRLPEQRLLELMLQLLLKQSEADSASVLLVNPDGKTLRLAASYGLEEEGIPRDDISIDDGIAGWVIRHNEPQVVVGQPQNDPRFTPRRKNPAEVGLVLPLRASHKVVGAICLTRKSTNKPFMKTTVDLGLLIGSEIARALERTKEDERRQDLERNLMQRDKLVTIGELVSGVAHEINNPLGFVASNLATLETYLNDLMAVIEPIGANTPDFERAARLFKELGITDIIEDIPACLKETQEGVERVLKIVSDLRMMARADTDVKEPASLNEILEGAIGILWNKIKYRAELVRRFGDLPPYPCFPTQMGQVFLNLLHNAVQAIPNHGTIVVTTRAEPDSIVIEVQDSGVGIPKENLDKLFEPFFTTKPRGEGTGLGLSIVRRIVDRHDGRIEVESTPGKGSLFRVILPWPVPANNTKV
ncbi:MAG: response regulator [Deltaproteobacteria bacterium]|nr:MAG: response regulator [Deltaproteobacteria bacterium]